ncbi:preprotein translocase subunit YajC [Anaerovorax odorimutans]|uniref:preprotein translocase subunit YajC n=1 Tax=Anaerovorax odorimutans TaxID=109327 RepID=UPI0004235307|nr:preprotein translocase subunit YajC [Anaerovorax odorimutans]
MNNQSLMTFVPLILLIFIMYFLLIRPQKKREKQVTAMRNAIKVGDDIITIGGICGKVVKTKDESLVIQVGADKTKFEVMRWSISKVVNANPAKNTAKSTDDMKDDVPKKALPKKLKKTESPSDEITEVEVEAEIAEEKDFK